MTMTSAKKDSLDTSRVPVYRIFRSNIRERVRLFSTLIVENLNSPEGNFLKLKHSNPIQWSFKTEDFSEEEEANFDEEDVKPFKDSDTDWDKTAALTAEIDNPDLGINETNQRKLKIKMNRLVVESPLFNANPSPTAVTQEEEKQLETTAEGIQNKSKKKLTKSTKVKSEPQRKPEEKERSFEISKTVEKKIKIKKKTNSKTSQRFPCKICGLSFSNKSSRHQHEYTHMSWDKLEKTNIYHEKCGICHKVFFSNRKYENHINYHNKVQPHQCRKCNRKFTEKGNLAKHILHVHSTAEERMKILESCRNECDVCSMKFRTPSLLGRHKLTHSDVKSFNCSQCDKKYKSKGGLAYHQRTHNGSSFKCGTCDTGISYLPSLKQHQLIHLNEKNFNCYFCHKQFIQKGNLTTHMMRVHLNERAFNCGHCKKGFVNKSDLTQHVKSVHLAIRFSCSKCTKTFRQKDYLNTHMKSVHR